MTVPVKGTAVTEEIEASADETSLEGKILRFRASERLVHWAIAIPFLCCYISAFILVFVFYDSPQHPLRAILSWLHRISGTCFILFPILAMIRCRGDVRIHFNNIMQAWSWTLDDIKWLSRMGLAAISSKVTLPEQGKFNAAEKLNFMLVMATYPLFILTGILVWLPGIAFVSWLAHFFMAVVITPFVVGHMYMAIINPNTRAGLQGMISGFVDRQWAKHHYRRWYRENFETGRGTDFVRVTESTLRRPAQILCPACSAVHSYASWLQVLEKILESDPLHCPHCHVSIRVVSPRMAESILYHLERGGVNEAFEGSARSTVNAGAAAE